MDTEKEKKQFHAMLIKLLIFFIIILYVALHTGHAYYVTQQSGTLDLGTLLEAINDNIADPLYIWPVEGGQVLLVMCVWLFIAYSIFMDYEKNRNTMYGKEHGSASFNTDYKGLLHGYIMSPKFLSKHFGKKYKTVKAPGGRKLCKKKRFSQKEIDYCKLQSQIYSKNVALSQDTSLTQLNLNTIVFGGSGAGKSRFFVMPNLLQANSSYVVTDPSGELKAGVGKYLESQGYEIKTLNIEDMSHSNRYNPFAYLHKESDILIMVKALTDNIEGPKKGGSGDNKFWDETSQTLLAALVGYLYEVCHDDNEFQYEPMLDENGFPVVDENNRPVPAKDEDGNPIYKMRQKKNENGQTVVDEDGNPIMEKVPNPHWKGCQNFTNLLRLLDMADASDDREEDQDDLDKLFADLELANPESYAVSQYKVIKQAGTGKTTQNILISTSAIFARYFRLKEIANLTFQDELHLEDLGKKKCALFIVTPQGDTTYNFLASMCYTQLFSTLYEEGEEGARRRGDTSVKLDVPVRCLIDEAANVGVIPGFCEKLATMRKYGISACPIYQNQAQVKALFKDDWETIVGNCDTMLFLGGIDASTVKTVSDRLGKGTINTHSENINGGGIFGSKPGSTGVQTSGRELMTTTEIEQMRNDHCIVFIRSMKPWNDYKYPLEKHPNYKYSGMCDPKNSYAGNKELVYDREQMARTVVRATDDPEYIPPERVPGVTDAEVARVRKKLDQNLEQAEKNMEEGTLIDPNGQPLVGFAQQVTKEDLAMEKFDEDSADFDESLRENLESNPIGRALLDLIDAKKNEPDSLDSSNADDENDGLSEDNEEDEAPDGVGDGDDDYDTDTADDDDEPDYADDDDDEPDYADDDDDDGDTSEPDPDGLDDFA